MGEQESSSNLQKAQQPQMINTGPSIMSKHAQKAMKQMRIKQAVHNAVNRVLQEEEAKLDNKIEKLSKMDEEDLEELRAKRLEEMKKKQIQRSKWLQNNHGRIHELNAQKHLECKFIQIESQYAPFLIERLNIWTMPTLVLAKDNKVSTQLRGLDWVAPDGKFTTINMEQKLFDYGFLAETYIAMEKQLEATSKKKVEDTDSEDDLFD